MIQKPKGTLDITGNDGILYKYLENYIDDFMSLYNYEFIKIPSFESTDLFYRSVGEATDIVNKETYDFIDKGDRKMTLRPEFTAGVVRSFIENKSYVDGVKKYYYFGSAFRYERPQNGRLREFTQAGVEAFGVSSPLFDAEIISLAYRLLSGLGLSNLVVKLNTLGDTESRREYNKIIKDYLSKDYDNLCDICKTRLQKNPLRILDCKYDSERDYIKNAPKIKDYLNNESKNYYEKVKDALDSLGIPYTEEDTLVRGLDYYTHTVFEIVSEEEGELGRASTVCAGGRYDDLVEYLDGPKTPGIGFAIGIERLMILLKEYEFYTPEKSIDVYLINMVNDLYAFQVLDDLRNSGFACEMDYRDKNLKNNFKIADKLNPLYILIIGEDEEKGGYITVKDNRTKEETKVKESELCDFLNMNI